jgi:hypothetical protein
MASWNGYCLTAPKWLDGQTGEGRNRRMRSYPIGYISVGEGERRGLVRQWNVFLFVIYVGMNHRLHGPARDTVGFAKLPNRDGHMGTSIWTSQKGGAPVRNSWGRYLPWGPRLPPQLCGLTQCGHHPFGTAPSEGPRLRL